MKRHGVAVLIWTGIVAIAIMAGCASDKGTKGGTGQDDIASEPIKLVLWGGVPIESGPGAVVDAWNRQHPDITLEYVRFVNDVDGNLKLDTALMTGQSVDLYFNYSLSQLERRVEAGVALELSRFDDYDPDRKMGADAAAWQIGGKYYGIPTKKNAFFVALNKDALDAAGLPVPTSWTWDEMRSYARELSKDRKYGWLQHMEPFPDPIDSLLVREGYVDGRGASNLDHPLVGHWLRTLYAMMYEDRSTPEYGEQITSKLPVEQIFLSGDAAMLNIGEWLLRSANNTGDYPRSFTIAFAPVPRLAEERADFVARGGLGDFLSIHPRSRHIEAAWEFVKWYSDGGMIPMAVGGRLPASQDADFQAAMPYFFGNREELYDIESLEYVLYRDETPTFVRSVPQPVYDLRLQQYEKYFLGMQTLEETLSQMKAKHDAYIHSPIP